ncbi:NAD(P)-dependent oxidoreductase [Streptomyces sp. S465]|uniref:NAD(P)-dependent oxidoreductase n=1 Tax=Streptomyces sp. S465 TaxID=2979468 RepID=UPI0022A85EE2|nr:NAD(P)-dependent oxidoreductase [Streptomyces sp. S465]WAP56737.1 NAD(P)-dependent oxidoreductase [Streptomyces sp. S465]
MRGGGTVAGGEATADRRPVVLIAEELSPTAVAALGPEVEIRERSGAGREALLRELAEADAVLVRDTTRIDAEALAAAPRLKVIATAGAGVGAVDVPAATAAGVMVVNAPTAHAVSAAELAVGLLLAVARGIPRADALPTGGRRPRSRPPGMELADKVLGLVGLGPVGWEVARRMRAFAMEVIAYDPSAGTGHLAAEGVRLVTLDELLARADLISVHLPETPEHRGLLGFEALHRIGPGARLVDVTGGGAVDQLELYAALKEGRVAAAGIVARAESPLAELDTVVVTPQPAAHTPEAEERAGVSAARSVRRVLGGEVVPEAVNVGAGTVPRAPAPWLALTERLAALVTAATGGPPPRLEIVATGGPTEPEAAAPEPTTREPAALEPAALELAALKGALTGAGLTRVSYVNAPALAEERGMTATATTAAPEAGGDRSVTVRATLPGGDGVSVTGALPAPDGTVRLVEICGRPLDFPLAGETLFLRCRDAAGVLGGLGAALGRGGVHITAMRVARTAPGGDAVVVLGVDRPVRPDLLTEAAGAVEATHWWTLSGRG